MSSLGSLAKEALSLMDSFSADLETSRWDSRIIVPTTGSENDDLTASTVPVGVELRGVTGMLPGDMTGEMGKLPGT